MFKSLSSILFSALVVVLPLALEGAETRPHNLIRVSDRIYSGAGPEGEADFKAIRNLGTNTIISVDGVTPDVKGAGALGMRYIHIPIGYDGITRKQAAELSQAMEETTGTLYVHCHHGQHRGPAAAALAWRLSTDCSATSATEVLERAKTGRDYHGLWAAMNMENLDQVREERPTLLETAKVADLTARMVLIDQSMDRLALAQKAGWVSPPDHPDVDPAQEVLMLEQHFREIGRAEDSKHPQDFRDWRAQAEKITVKLRDDLKAGQKAGADGYYADLRQNCRSCHVAYRNNR
ncbi:hypothetical protein IT570_08280 [Candidatus Sumerlaeota bacterium]|nr:hypothetical protein [Candidatus Sumerlaeota bacterium]